MAGCFNNSPHDRWIESQVDAYTDGKAFRLSLRDKQLLDDTGLDESDLIKTEEFRFVIHKRYPIPRASKK